jgi:hypothetical protein
MFARSFESHSALYRLALPLTFLIALGVVLPAQSQDFLPPSPDASVPSAFSRPSPNGMQLQNALLDVAIPAAGSIQENWAGRKPARHRWQQWFRISDHLAFEQPAAGGGAWRHASGSERESRGRPALATSALLTPIGYAQFETGVLYAEDSAGFSSRNAEEETMRVTVSSRMQLILAAEPIAASFVAGQQSTERGNTTGGIQVVLMPGHAIKPTVSVSYLRLVRAGNATNLDIGGYANSALILASSDLGHFHVDVNGFANETEGPIRRAQFGQAVALTHPVTPKLSATAEFRHFTEPLNAGEGLSAMWAAGYAVRPNWSSIPAWCAGSRPLLPAGRWPPA